MKSKLVLTALSMLIVTGCDKVATLTGSGVKCDNETAKELIVESFSKKLSDASAERVKSLIASENITIDMGKLRASLANVSFNVNDIRTNNSDPNSKKEYCVTTFVVNLPSNMIKDANDARDVYGEVNVAQSAVLSDLSLESNTLKTSLDYIDEIFDEFMELHGDRNFKDDKAIVCGLARIDKQNYTVIAEQKGRTTKENIERNFGMPNPESYRKAIRFMKQAEKFNRPVITFIDTKGAYPGIGAEERGQRRSYCKFYARNGKTKSSNYFNCNRRRF